MGLAYKTQIEKYVIGTAGTKATLTTSYAGNTSENIDAKHFAEATYLVQYTPGADASTLKIQIEGTADDLTAAIVAGTTPHWQICADSSVSGGVVTLTQGEYDFVGATGGTTYTLAFYVPPAFLGLRIAAKSAAAGTVSIQLLLSGV